MNRTVLVTGFEPFGGERCNPSGELARRLDGARLHGRRVVGTVLPVVFGASARQLQRSLREHDPELVVSLGVAGGRRKLSVERVAINVDDARIPDNAGQQPIDEPIRRRGPAAYFATLPVKAMFRTLQQGGWPAEVSHSAGSYVCNHVFYCLIHTLRRRPGARGGFIHVPRPRRDFGLDAMEAALRQAIVTAIRVKTDARMTTGRED